MENETTFIKLIESWNNETLLQFINNNDDKNNDMLFHVKNEYDKRINPIIIICPKCSSNKLFKDGIHRNNKKRYKCSQCKLRFTEGLKYVF